MAKRSRNGANRGNAGPQHSSPLHAPLVLATCILASSLAFIDGSVVNVGLPAIARGLQANGGTLSWVINAYMLPLSSLLLLGGSLGDLYGPKRILIGGTVLFLVASVLCTFAVSLTWLIAGRVLQGVGAAMLMPNSLAILGTNFDGETRGRAIGIWAAVGAAAAAAGPLLGGWLIDLLGWRSIFVVNLPIATAAIYLAARFIRDERDVQCRGLDLPGAALAMLALTTLTWTLTIASTSKPMAALDWCALTVGLIALAAFVVTENRRGERAMLPPALFGSREFIGLTILTFLLYGALAGLMVLIPYVLIELHHYTAVEAGAALLPLPVLLAVCSPMMGRLAGRIGARWPLTIGPLIVAIGCVLTTRVGLNGSYWTTTFPALMMVSLGMAAAVAPLTTAVLSSVEKAHTGIASGFNSAVARCGGLVATALLSAVFAAEASQQPLLVRITALISAVACVAAAAAAFIGLPHRKGSE